VSSVVRGSMACSE